MILPLVVRKMLIEVESLTQGGKPFAHTYDSGRFSLEDDDVRLLEDIEVKGRARRKGETVKVSGEIRTKIEKLCDRCLAPVEQAVDANFDVTYVPPEEDFARETPTLEAEDLEVSVLENGAVDVDELVREQVLLAVDSRSLCREDCRGLCPTCGANLNAGDCACDTTEIDPRWAALKTLSDN